MRLHMHMRMAWVMTIVMGMGMVEAITMAQPPPLPQPQPPPPLVPPPNDLTTPKPNERGSNTKGVAFCSYVFTGLTELEGYSLVVWEYREDPESQENTRETRTVVLKEEEEFTPWWPRPDHEHVFFAIKGDLPTVDKLNEEWLSQTSGKLRPLRRRLAWAETVDTNLARKIVYTLKVSLEKTGEPPAETLTVALTPVKAILVDKDGKELCTVTLPKK